MSNLDHRGLDLDLLCVRQSDAAPFCENYTKLYFDAKHLEKKTNSFFNFFYQKSAFLANKDAALIF